MLSPKVPSPQNDQLESLYTQTSFQNMCIKNKRIEEILFLLLFYIKFHSKIESVRISAFPTLLPEFLAT